MNPELQIKAIAELDGWTDFISTLDASHGIGGTHPQWSGVRYTPCPEYLTSRDAIVPVIEKFVNNYHKQLKFYLALQKIVFVEDSSPYSIEVLCICATPSQLCEALLRATGKWLD